MENILKKPEIWAGIECTINRLRTGYSDQLKLNGHYHREDDIDAIAALGITTLRYPVLWEKHQPEKDGAIDFTWVSQRLNRLRELNIKPIAGLCHHGSGPEHTNLLDPEFPYMLAAYAKQVAEEFPWIQMYTPVNEPLTTARFSGLYGLWYPHKETESSYIKMLLIQLKAVVLSMKEIRKVNPDAKLVQTEDLGKTYSTPLLQYQAEKENQRRFYTQDILCGQFTKEHLSWSYFMTLGIPEEDLNFFIENPCPPDILGVNYYPTSERYLDENMEKYPESRHGGNAYHEYADVEAVRVRFDEPHGFSVLMKELWERFHIPIAVTEAHMHCSREGQMKWFLEIYESACKLQQEGVVIPAVTAWSVLGAYGWNKLLVSPEMEYERGIFDVSSGKRRPTAMAGVITTLAQTGSFSSHVLNGDGWWKTDARYFGIDNKIDSPKNLPVACRPILIIGKTGTLGRAFSKVCYTRSLHHILLGREDVDICNYDNIESIISQFNPWAIINAAGYVRVDDAEADSERCFRENTTGPGQLAIACKKHGVQFMTFSSDLVFDGEKNTPYLESDSANPLNVYGRSKADAEQNVLATHPESLIIRASAFFGPWDQYNFAHAVLQTLSEGNIFYASNDIISPTYVPHLVDAALDLLIDEEHGIWHLTNNHAISWYDFAREVALRCDYDPEMIAESTSELPAKRPAYSVMQSEKGLLMPSFEVALDEYISEVPVRVQTAS
ncbi:MAG TPA: family 1 glycosylhydrolase [Flavobacterium sp.]|jgi:dTDP-4-dehydrorhamnose reductase